MSIKGTERRDSGIDEPHPAVLAGGQHSAVIAPIVAQHNNDSRREGGVNPGRPVDEPLSTVTASGAQQGIVAPFMAKYYGVDQDPQMSEPLHTITAKDRFSLYHAAMSRRPSRRRMRRGRGRWPTGCAPMASGTPANS